MEHWAGYGSILYCTGAGVEWRKLICMQHQHLHHQTVRLGTLTKDQAPLQEGCAQSLGVLPEALDRWHNRMHFTQQEIKDQGHQVIKYPKESFCVFTDLGLIWTAITLSQDFR